MCLLSNPNPNPNCNIGLQGSQTKKNKKNFVYALNLLNFKSIIANIHAVEMWAFDYFLAQTNLWRCEDLTLN